MVASVFVERTGSIRKSNVVIKNALFCIRNVFILLRLLDFNTPVS